MPRHLFTIASSAVLSAALLHGCSSSSSVEKKDDANVAKADDKATTSSSEGPFGAFGYPNTTSVGQEDDYHGTVVKDPYRWLEDPDADDTKAWVNAQNKVTFGYLESIGSRKSFQDRLTTLWNYERYSPPFKKGEWVFYKKNDGLQNQAVLYKQKGLAGAPEVLLDPNTLSEDGTVALAATAFTDDGKQDEHCTNRPVEEAGACLPAAR